MRRVLAVGGSTGDRRDDLIVGELKMLLGIGRKLPTSIGQPQLQELFQVLS